MLCKSGVDCQPNDQENSLNKIVVTVSYTEYGKLTFALTSEKCFLQSVSLFMNICFQTSHTHTRHMQVYSFMSLNMKT